MPAVFWFFCFFFPGNCLHGQNPSIRKMIWELSLRVYPVLPCLVAHSVQHSSGVSLELLRYKRCRREVQAASKGKICITLALAKRNGLPADHKLPLYLSWHRPLSHSTEELFRRIQHTQKRLAFQRNQEKQRASAKWPLSSFWWANKRLLTRWNPEEGDDHQGLVLKCSAHTESDPFLSK